MFTGQINKMRTSLGETVQYELKLGDDTVKMNDLLGKTVQMKFTGRIQCVSCGKNTKKSFGQGFCYPCFMNSPDNAECIIKPELCRAHLGEGRDVEWEKAHHHTEHFVYLALSSDVKVGVTRSTQVPTRWIDQGASKAIIIARTDYRQLAGAIEVDLKNYLTDKTNWQRMLKNEVAGEIELRERKQAAVERLKEEFRIHVHEENTVTEINYPVLEYPKKVVSMNFEKMPEITGTLVGIKAQYLMFDGGRVINLRAQSGYVIDFNFNQ